MASTNLFAEEPLSQIEQCEQFSSYQDSDGQWQPCETEPDESEFHDNDQTEEDTADISSNEYEQE
jgi:hypothetical protein